MGFYERVEGHVHLVFLLPAVCLWMALLFHPLIWDEGLYVELAGRVAENPFDPLPSGYRWVPHPPLFWYMLSPLRGVPRLPVLLTSAVCLLSTYWASRKLFGDLAARYSVAFTLASWNYVAYSLIVFPDMVTASFATVSVLALLVWLNERRDRYLLLSGVGYVLASLSKYTSGTLLTLTFTAWLLMRRKGLDRASLVKGLVCILLANLPLTAWLRHLSTLVGRDAYTYYSAVYNHQGFTLHYDVAYYVGIFALTLGPSLALWLKGARRFDGNMKLTAVYALVTLLFFSSMRSLLHLCQMYDRYLLPINAPAAVVSAKLASEEVVQNRVLIVGAAFLYLILLLYVATLLL